MTVIIWNPEYHIETDMEDCRNKNEMRIKTLLYARGATEITAWGVSRMVGKLYGQKKLSIKF